MRSHNPYSDEILENAASFGWELPALVASGQLVFIDAHLSPEVVATGEFELTLLLARLADQARAMGATRIVFDAIDVLLTLMDDPRAERHELYRVRAWLKAQRLTGIITARVEGEESCANSRYSFLQYMADCVISLERPTASRCARSAWSNIAAPAWRKPPFPLSSIVTASWSPHWAPRRRS